MKANGLKRGTVFQVDGQPIMVKQVQVQTASSRSGNTLYKVRGQDILSRQKFEASFKGDDVLTDIDISRRAVQLLYRDSDSCTFMDTESYEQYTLADEAIEEELPFLSEGLKGVTALIADGVLLGIELPVSRAGDCGVRAGDESRLVVGTHQTGDTEYGTGDTGSGVSDAGREDQDQCGDAGVHRTGLSPQP